MSLRGARWLLVPVVMGGSAWLGGGCGARSAVPVPPPAPDCYVDADCEGAEDLCNPVVCELLPPETLPDGGVVSRGGVCTTREPVDCDDGDPCTADTCAPETGRCSYGPATFDQDGDGFLGPRPGTQPGDVDACGDDCDDTNGTAFPGGEEVCDGVDNDCDGTVDNGAEFVPLAGGDAVRVSGDVAPAGPGGLAFSGTSYAAIYSGTQQGFSVYRTMLDPEGSPLPPGEGAITAGNGDASGGPVVWVGDRYGVAWQDRRTGDYEVYFSLLDADGNKVEGGDRQLTSFPGFSINVSLTWNGAEFITVWQDEREGLFNLYAQRLDVGANLIGTDVPLLDPFSGYSNEGPSVAAGGPGMAVAWTASDGFSTRIRVQLFDPELLPIGIPVDLTDGTSQAVYPTVVWNQDRFVVAWYDKTRFPTAIYAAVIGEGGEVLVAPQPITNPGSARSRYPFLRPLGDRVLVVYADDRDQNAGYEIYSTVVGADLSPRSPEQRITFAQENSISPIASFGPAGELGILFRDDRLGANHVFFTRLGCVAETPSPPPP
ncbi:putative metal-binding motif-containing protein [Chondromyces apiculatus]|uniref:RTX toxins and Ca2+-binding protein n=1 Tax=Chondromyces apiculatus DSM 436 TaxID=1192034 RepID=A0A017TGA4_9BACT|nr:putative metal-binding motif-containing protein [Chondromyces apiculatus]EYF07947.1 RTX toxins and Ca2+-binding protein [Chondromyces apiculatus DSM 436]